MENSASSPENEISISNAVHRFVVIGPQTEDLLKESDLLGKNAEVVYSADNVNQWDIETERIEADLVVIECTTVFPETVNIIKEKTRAVGASMAYSDLSLYSTDSRGMMARVRLLTPLRAPITNEDLKYVCEADLAMATIRNSSLEMMEFNDEESSEEALESTKVPIRKYDDAVLNRLAKISTSIDCECPHHMAALLKITKCF